MSVLPNNGFGYFSVRYASVKYYFGYFTKVFAYFQVFVSLISRVCQFAYFTRFCRKIIVENAKLF